MLGLDEGWQWPPHMAPFHALHYPSLGPPIPATLSRPAAASAFSERIETSRSERGRL